MGPLVFVWYQIDRWSQTEGGYRDDERKPDIYYIYIYIIDLLRASVLCHYFMLAPIMVLCVVLVLYPEGIISYCVRCAVL